MMLNLIAARVGTPRVTQIAEQFIVEHVRDNNAQQRMPLVARLGSAEQVVCSEVICFDGGQYRREPLLARGTRETCEYVADGSCSGYSVSILGMTPTHYYLTLRLRRARELLLQTDMSIMHITMACGFQSACHF